MLSPRICWLSITASANATTSCSGTADEGVVGGVDERLAHQRVVQHALEVARPDELGRRQHVPFVQDQIERIEHRPHPEREHAEDERAGEEQTHRVGRGAGPRTCGVASAALSGFRAMMWWLSKRCTPSLTRNRRPATVCATGRRGLTMLGPPSTGPGATGFPAAQSRAPRPPTRSGPAVCPTGR